MNKTLNLQDLATALQAEQITKRDVIVPSTLLSMQGGQLVINNATYETKALDTLLNNAGIQSSGSALVVPSQELFEPLDICHRQIADKLDIPVRYYERLRTEQPDMLDYNVTEWLHRKPSNYFLRTFTRDDGSAGIARAFLSDRFKVIDHLDILVTALDAIRQSGQQVLVESADLTDRRMYIRCIAPSVVKAAPELLKAYKVPDGTNRGGFGVAAGFVLSNSETGHGTFTIAPRLVILACRNGMIRHDDRMAERHLGSKMSVGAFDWSEATRAKELELIQSQVYDAVTAYLSFDYLGKVIDAMTENGAKLLDHPLETVQNMGIYLGFTDEKKQQLINYFVQSGDLSGFGAVQSLTYLAQTVEPDERYDIEASSVAVLDNINKFDRSAVKSANELGVN